MDIDEFSEDLLLQVKMQQPTAHITAQLENILFSELRSSLKDEARKKAFWINIYNAYFQILRKDYGVKKPEIYRNKLVTIARQPLSLDNIEHGILRKYRYKFALGYLPNPFTPAIVKMLSVSTIDYRIHFALNGGAKSCPPIAFYAPDKIEWQLDMATISFLESETVVVPEKKEIHISRLFQWFIGDFGGRRGIRRILKEKLDLEKAGMKLVFTDYNWEEALDNFAEH